MIRRLAIGAAVLALSLGAAAGAETLPYPDVTDTSHATPEAVKVLKAFFVAKSAHKPADMMAIFAPGDSVLYIDASSGNSWPNWDALNKIFTTLMPKMKPEALSYPLRILGDRHSALVYFEDTPELFGKELRTLHDAGIDFNGGTRGLNIGPVGAQARHAGRFDITRFYQVKS